MAENDETQPKMTETEAVTFLLGLAREEAKRLELAAKMYALHSASAPADVRRSARKHQQILEAIEVIQGAH